MGDKRKPKHVEFKFDESSLVPARDGIDRDRFLEFGKPQPEVMPDGHVLVVRADAQKLMALVAELAALREQVAAAEAEVSSCIAMITERTSRGDELAVKLVAVEARADATKQGQDVLRGILAQTYGAVTQLDNYLTRNPRNFQMEKANDFIHRLYALTDADQVDAALLAAPAEAVRRE